MSGRARRFFRHPGVLLVLAVVLAGVMSTGVQALTWVVSEGRAPPILLSASSLMIGSLAGMGLVALLSGVSLGRQGLGRPLLRPLLQGSVGGLLLIGSAWVLGLLVGGYRVAGVVGVDLQFLWMAALFALVAVGEELFFRGIILRLVEDWLGSWIAVAVSGAAFGLLHLGNPNASLWSASAIALEAGVLFAAVFIATRTLWLPIGLHWTWNLTEGPLLGLPVSGVQFGGVIDTRVVDGAPLLSGGDFGPEAALPTVILCTAVGLAVLGYGWRRGRIISPRWVRRRAEAV